MFALAARVTTLKPAQYAFEWLRNESDAMRANETTPTFGGTPP